MISGGYFFAFGLLAVAHFRKLFFSGFQVSISLTFYKQLLGTKMFLQFLYLQFGFVILCQENANAKAALKIGEIDYR
jgi:hypothetical protein